MQFINGSQWQNIHVYTFHERRATWIFFFLRKGSHINFTHYDINKYFSYGVEGPGLIFFLLIYHVLYR